MTDPTTHSPTCYREHHACAVARLDRLREEVATADRLAADLPNNWLTDWLKRAIVAVRDITEGR